MFGYINNKYCWELCGIRNIRQVEDGISFITLNITWDRYEADHKPSFEIYFGMFNCTILEFKIYNINHVGD